MLQVYYKGFFFQTLTEQVSHSMNFNLQDLNFMGTTIHGIIVFQTYLISQRSIKLRLAGFRIPAETSNE